MKTILAACLCTLFTLVSIAGELKVATVDLQEVLHNYTKAKEVLKSVQIQEVSLAKELDGLKLEGQKLWREAEQLQASINDLSLSAAERDSRRKLWEEKLQNLRTFSVQYDQVRLEKETELRVTLERSNRKVLEEIVTVTRRIGEKEGFNLVLNTNKENPAAGEVVFSKGVTDLTGQVLASLNQVRR
jgi:Skp family chaperone for outer membrane proteins